MMTLQTRIKKSERTYLKRVFGLMIIGMISREEMQIYLRIETCFNYSHVSWEVCHYKFLLYDSQEQDVHLDVLSSTLARQKDIGTLV